MDLSRRAFVVSLGAGLGLLSLGDWAFAQRVPDKHGLDPFAIKDELSQDEAYLTSFEWSTDEHYVDIFET